MVTNYLRMLRLFSRDVRLFLVTAALVGLAWDGVRTVLFNLYVLRLGYGPEFIGLVNAVGALGFALMSLPAGALGKRWGSRSMQITGAGLMAVGSCLLPLADVFTGAPRTGWLLATTLLTNFGLSLYLVSGLPFLMGTTGPEERNHVFSVHIALIPLAAFAGSLLAGALPGALATLLGTSLDETAPYRYTLWLSALLLIPAVLALLPTRSVDGLTGQAPAARAAAPPASRAPYGLLIAIALIMAFRFGGRGTVTTFFNVYLDEGLGTSTVLIGVLSAVGQLLSVPAALAAPLLTARSGYARPIFWGTLGMALCILPLALIPHWAAAGLGFISSGVLFSTSIGPIRVFSQELVTPDWRSTMASAFMMGAGLSFSGMSLLGGYAITSLGYRPLFLIGTVLGTAGAFLFWFCFRVPRGELARQPVPGSGE